MRVNSGGQTGWGYFDPETLNNKNGGVAHMASVTQNVRVIGEDALHAAIPGDRMIQLTYLGFPKDWAAGVLGFIVGLFWDIFEVVTFALMLPKHLIDIVAHTGAAGVNLVQGK